MTELLIKNTTLVQIRTPNISLLKGADLKELPVLEKAWIRCQGDRIRDFGLMDNCPNFKIRRFLSIVLIWSSIISPSLS